MDGPGIEPGSSLGDLIYSQARRRTALTIREAGARGIEPRSGVLETPILAIGRCPQGGPSRRRALPTPSCRARYVMRSIGIPRQQRGRLECLREDGTGRPRRPQPAVENDFRSIEVPVDSESAFRTMERSRTTAPPSSLLNIPSLCTRAESNRHPLTGTTFSRLRVYQRFPHECIHNQVPTTRIELVRPCGHGFLRPARLPRVSATSAKVEARPARRPLAHRGIAFAEQDPGTLHGDREPRGPRVSVTYGPLRRPGWHIHRRCLHWYRRGNSNPHVLTDGGF